MSVLEKIGPRPALSFAGFVFWLAAFPMAGPLLGARADLFWFLLPHTLLLLLFSRVRAKAAFQALTVAAAFSSALLTWAFPWGAGLHGIALALLGITAAPVSLRAVVSLRAAPSPLSAALFGLVVGNLLVAVLKLLPFSEPVLFAFVGAMLLPTLLAPIPDQAIEGGAKGVLFYLPFVFVFQLVSGLMYGFLFPAYGEYAVLAGSELLLYMAGAAVAAALIRTHRDLTLAAGVALAMGAFALLVFGGGPLSVNLSMYTMMAAAGFIDLFLLGYVLSFGNALRAYGLGGGVLCAGIAAGRWLSVMAGDAGADIGLVGSLLLNFAVLTLFLLGHRRHQEELTRFLKSSEPREAVAALPAGLNARLSEQERQVLVQVLAHKTYRDVASELEISESSVKTYMRRICQKSGVSGKRQLIALLSGEEPETAEPSPYTLS